MKEESQSWLEYAREDFEVGDSLRDSYYRNSVWAYEQAAEKSVKALLIECGIDFPKTHDLVALMNFLPMNIHSDIKAAAMKLSAFGPIRRYPGSDLEIGQEDAVQVRESASLICDWVKQTIDVKN